MNIPREFTESDEVLSQWSNWGVPWSSWDLIAVAVGVPLMLWLCGLMPGPWF
jgi:hypothetical protein